MIWIVQSKDRRVVVEGSSCCIEPDGAFVVMGVHKALVAAFAPGHWDTVRRPPPEWPQTAAELESWLEKERIGAVYKGRPDPFLSPNLRAEKVR